MGFYPFSSSLPVQIRPSGDPTGAADFAAWMGAFSSAGPSGATIIPYPGDYFVSGPLRWNQLAASGSVHAPTIRGPGSGGNATAAAPQPGVIRLFPSPTYPIGEFMIDYLGPTAVNASMAGFTVGGLAIMGKDVNGIQRAAGLRGFNQWMARWENIAIVQPYTGASAIQPGGIAANGAVSMFASPTSNALKNQLEQIWVTQAAFTGFYLQEGPGSMLTAINCEDFQSAAYGFDIGPLTTLIGCNAQAEGFAQFRINDDNALGGANVQMIGCQSMGASFNSSVEALNMVGEQFMTLECTGCFFGYCAGSNVGGDSNAIARFSGNPNAIFTDCTFAATNANINKYVALAAGLTAGSLVKFDGCQMTGQMWGNTPAAVYNLNANPGSMLQIRGTPLANPFGTTVVAVPATTVATAALPFDAVFYATGAAGGSCTLTAQGGPTITVPANVLVPVTVPAGKTLTPVYGAGNAPTWTVEGL